MPPVRDCEGHIVWHVRVTPDELTCLDCGEVAIRGHCVRCAVDEPDEGDEDAPDPTPRTMRPQRLVPTVSYLREGEWTR